MINIPGRGLAYCCFELLAFKGAVCGDTFHMSCSLNSSKGAIGYIGGSKGAI